MNAATQPDLSFLAAIDSVEKRMEALITALLYTSPKDRLGVYARTKTPLCLELYPGMERYTHGGLSILRFRIEILDSSEELGIAWNHIGVYGRAVSGIFGKPSFFQLVRPIFYIHGTQGFIA